MSDEEAIEYTALELYVIDSKVNAHLDIAEADTARDIAKIFKTMCDKDSLSSIATIMATKVLEVKGEEFCHDFLDAIRDTIAVDGPAIRPRDVIARIVKAGGI